MNLNIFIHLILDPYRLINSSSKMDASFLRITRIRPARSPVPSNLRADFRAATAPLEALANFI
jgi:hypothetical protein